MPIRLFSLLTLVLLAATTHSQDPKPGRIRVLLLGDSTVIGTVPRDVAPKADHLEDVVRKLLAAEKDLPAAEVINLGVNGDMIHKFLEARYDKQVAKQPAFDFVFIRYGLNDVRHLTDFKADFPSNLKKLIQRLRADHPKAEIVLETVIPYLGEEKDSTINEQVKAVAAAEKLPMLDQYGPYSAELKHGPNMLSYRRKALKEIPEQYHTLIPAESIKAGNVYILDNLLDVHFGKLPGWYTDRHPNLAGYQVIGTQIAKYLIPRIREQMKK
ncbi:MAG: SGNH/GDSL hydrolase family protein [Planctomycetes bacterium]|nr:SGNH/GDSL hydrolase family protein [Planctomycetota bacterium]